MTPSTISLGIRGAGFLAVVTILFRQVLAAKRGVWGERQWAGFGGRLVLSALLFAIGVLMGYGVDAHVPLAGPDHSTQRAVYVVIALVIALGGVLLGVRTLTRNAELPTNDRAAPGSGTTLVIFILLLLIGLWIGLRVGAPPGQLILIGVGGFSLWCGVVLPRWVLQRAALTSQMTPGQLRILYLAIGAAVMVAAFVVKPTVWAR